MCVQDSMAAFTMQIHQDAEDTVPQKKVVGAVVGYQAGGLPSW